MRKITFTIPGLLLYTTGVAIVVSHSYKTYIKSLERDCHEYAQRAMRERILKKALSDAVGRVWEDIPIESKLFINSKHHETHQYIKALGL